MSKTKSIYEVTIEVTTAENTCVSADELMRAIMSSDTIMAEDCHVSINHLTQKYVDDGHH